MLVGGIGVMADGDYGFDTNVLDIDDDSEEAIALAATTASRRPTTISADRITVDGTRCAISDATTRDLRSNPAARPASPT